jgi:broad specificity phosphatase PhoE
VTVGELTLAIPGAGVRLVLARHGQTPSNVRAVLDTLPPGPGLTDEGLRQAHRLADRLAGEKVQAVYASQARRAQETARPVADRHELDVTIVEGAQEIYVGELEGTSDRPSLRRFHEIYTSWQAGRLDEPMPGGETGRQALTRFLAAAHQAVDGVSAGAVVMVGHGAMLRLAAAHLSSNIEGSQAIGNLPNTGVIVLEPAPSTVTGWQCVQWERSRPR